MGPNESRLYAEQTRCHEQYLIKLRPLSLEQGSASVTCRAI